MKNAKKIVMGGVAALALVTVSVMGTMAYFTSKTETVNNTFTVGNVNIKLDEAPTDALGNVVEGGRRTSNTYNLLPGKDYTKDPTVHVAANSEDCYLFVTVKDDISAIEGTREKSDKLPEIKTIAAQISDNGWKEVKDNDGNTLTKDGAKVYVYTGDSTSDTPAVIEKSDEVVDKIVFGNFIVKDTETNLSAYDKATITVNGYAIQTVGFEDKSPADIWAEASK